MIIFYLLLLSLMFHLSSLISIKSSDYSHFYDNILASLYVSSSSSLSENVSTSIPNPLRRSTRTKHPPANLDAYVCHSLAEHSINSSSSGNLYHISPSCVSHALFETAPNLTPFFACVLYSTRYLFPIIIIHHIQSN